MTFGTYGPRIREQVAEMVKAEHEASLDAQDASGHRSRSVYGEFWRGLLEKFETFGELPGATLVRPGEAPYRLPVVNGVVLFPWRYAKSRDTEFATTRFATSDARIALSTLRTPSVQHALDLDLPDPRLSEEERQLLAALHAADPVISSSRMVLVAVSSSVRGLFAAEWGEAKLNAAGFIEWVGRPENLLQLPRSGPVSTSPISTFTDGVPPKKVPGAELDEAADDPNDE
ncbi:MAG: hypothetical protein AB7V44_26015 [Pseudonocardia sp.]